MTAVVVYNKRRQAFVAGITVFRSLYGFNLQLYNKLRACAFFRIYRYASACGIDYSLWNRHTESRSAYIFVGHLTFIRLEYLFGELLAHTYAVVPDPYLIFRNTLFAVIRFCKRKRNIAAVVCEFYRIWKEVHYKLFKSVLIATHNLVGHIVHTYCQIMLLFSRNAAYYRSYLIKQAG